MKLFILGLIVLLIIVCQIYKIIREKNIENMTATEYKEFIDHELDFTKKTIKYYQTLNYGKTDVYMKNSKPNFVHLNSQNQLIFDDYASYKKSIEGFHGKNVREETSKKIETCRNLTSCEQLDENQNCGYCGELGKKINGGGGSSYNTDGKFEYRPAALGGKEIGPDICPSDALEKYPAKGQSKGKPLGNRWATTSYDCKKIQLQDKCSSITNCNELNGDLGEICGWCPSDKAYPKGTFIGNGDVLADNTLLYNMDNTDETQIKNDRCVAFHEKYIDSSGAFVPYTSELKQAKDCSVCDKPEGRTKDGIRWSDECLQELWETPLTSDKPKFKVGCTTDYNDPSNNEMNFGDEPEHSYQGNWGASKWYKVMNSMNKRIKNPIFNFMSDYKDPITPDQTNYKWKKGDEFDDYLYPDLNVRRKWKMDDKETSYSSSKHYNNPNINIKTIWGKCFNKFNKDNS
jgi:hypothetical protein